MFLAGTAAASPQGADWLVADSAEGCASCHLGSPDAADSPAIAIEGLPERVAAGQAYTLRIVLSDPALQIAGFLLKASAGSAAEEGGDANAKLATGPGTFSSVDATTEARGDRVRSTRAGALPPAPGSMRWTVVWTAPSTPGDMTKFEIWANAGNDDLSPLGDRLHRRVWQVRMAD